MMVHCCLGLNKATEFVVVKIYIKNKDVIRESSHSPLNFCAKILESIASS